MFSISPSSEFARERFKELMGDGQPHSFIAACLAQMEDHDYALSREHAEGISMTI